MRLTATMKRLKGRGPKQIPNTYPFHQPPTLREFGKAIDRSPQTIRAWVRAGVVPIVYFPHMCVEQEFANTFVRSGFTQEAKEQLEQWNAENDPRRRWPPNGGEDD
jgi:hypothetical protein